MTIIETVLIFAGIPALVIVAIAGLVFANEMRGGGGKRYRPGRPFEFRPVWFLSAPEHVTGDGSGEHSVDHKALDAADTPVALPAPPRPGTAGDWPATDEVQQRATGGASDRW